MIEKFTKLMLSLALLVAGAVGASAEKLYADLSKLSNGPVSTWDGATSTMTWTGTSNNMISNFDFPIGNYREYQTISVTVSDLTNAVGLRLQIKANGQEKLVALNGNGTFTKYLIDDFGFTSSDLTKVEWVRLLGSAWQNGESNTIDAEHPASAVISDVYLTQPTRTLKVDLNEMAASDGNATWDSSNGTFAWTGTYSNAIALPGLSGSLASFTTVNYETAAGTCDHFRILVYYSNGAAQTTYYASVGNKSVRFADMGVSVANLPFVSSVKISGANDATGDITLNSFSLEGPMVNYIETSTVQATPEGVTDINGMTDAGSNKWSIAYPLTIGNGTQFGGNIDGDDKSVDISAYDYLLFVVSDASADANTGLRVFVSTASSNDNSTRAILYPHPIADYASVSNWAAQSFITASGIYVVKISDYPLLRGVKNLAYWQGSAGTVTISQAYLGSGSPMAPSESEEISGTEALSDANATCFDVTGLTDMGLTYNSANPNALFIAKAGTLTNTKNVIVDGICDNLEITEGTPFKAPVGFTATTAKYTKAVSAAGYATAVVPFAVASLPAGVEAYNVTVSGASAVLENVNALAANTPVVIEASAGDYDFTASGVEVSATPSDAQTNGALSVSYADSTPADAYVLANKSGVVGFYKLGAGVTVPAGKAYLQVEAAGRDFIGFGTETTGIKNVESVKGEGEVYNLKGQRVAAPAKGLYVVDGKKVVLK